MNPPLTQQTINELSQDITWAFENSTSCAALVDRLMEAFNSYDLKELVKVYSPQQSPDGVSIVYLSVGKKKVALRRATRSVMKVLPKGEHKAISGERDKGVVAETVTEVDNGWEAAGYLPGETPYFHRHVESCVALIVDWMILGRSRDQFQREVSEVIPQTSEKWAHEKPAPASDVSPEDRESFALVLRAVETGKIPDTVAFRCLMAGMRHYLKFPMDELETDLLATVLEFNRQD